RNLVEVLRHAPVPGGRLRLDGIRLPRRAHSLRMAVYQLPFRHYGYVRFPQGQLLLLPGMVGIEARAASLPALELAGQGGPGGRSLGPQQHGARGAVSQWQEPRRPGHGSRYTSDVESEI